MVKLIFQIIAVFLAGAIAKAICEGVNMRSLAKLVNIAVILAIAVVIIQNPFIKSVEKTLGNIGSIIQKTADGTLFKRNNENPVFTWPLTGRVTQFYSNKNHGIDIAANEGAPIKASSDGLVLVADTDKTYGNFVVIQHNNSYQTLYAHCSTVQVKQNQQVKQGDTIALAGNTGNSTGPHLHFEVRNSGQTYNPLDYLK